VTVRTVNLLFALLAVTTLTGVLAWTSIAIAARLGIAGSLRDDVWDHTADVALPLAAIVAVVAMLGSLYESEVAGFIPCALCWYQRIAMYSMAIILPIAAWRGDTRIRVYAMPLALIGALISTYHYQLEWFPKQASPACTAAAPCTVVWVRELGFVSIPFMALCGFLAIAWLTWIAGQRATADALRPNAHTP
jgi:disulfide bond formation protein DsbB